MRSEPTTAPDADCARRRLALVGLPDVDDDEDDETGDECMAISGGEGSDDKDVDDDGGDDGGESGLLIFPRRAERIAATEVGRGEKVLRSESRANCG